MVKFNCISRNNKKQEVSKSHVLNSTTAKGNIDVGEKSKQQRQNGIRQIRGIGINGFSELVRTLRTMCCRGLAYHI